MFQKYAWLSAALFGIMLLCFEALMNIPGVVAAPHNRIIGSQAVREFFFSWGALSFAAALPCVRKRNMDDLSRDAKTFFFGTACEAQPGNLQVGGGAGSLSLLRGERRETQGENRLGRERNVPAPSRRRGARHPVNPSRHVGLVGKACLYCNSA